MDLVEIRKKAKSRKRKADAPAARKEAGKPEKKKPGASEQPESEPLNGSNGSSGTAEDKERQVPPEEKTEAVETLAAVPSDSLSGLESVLMRQRGEEVEEEEEEQLQLLTFMLGPEEYALNIMDIKEIIRPREVTEVPKTPEYIQGILSLRGTIIPVLDVDKRLGLSTADRGSENRIVVVKWREHLFGLLVDRVVQVLNIPIGLIDPPPEIIGGVEGEFLRGVGKLDDRLIILLNLGRILAIDEAELAAAPESLPGSQR
jgi:purine-binding chemotaxis protein CheW